MGWIIERRLGGYKLKNKLTSMKRWVEEVLGEEGGPLRCSLDEKPSHKQQQGHYKHILCGHLLGAPCQGLNTWSKYSNLPGCVILETFRGLFLHLQHRLPIQPHFFLVIPMSLREIQGEKGSECALGPVCRLCTVSLGSHNQPFIFMLVPNSYCLVPHLEAALGSVKLPILLLIILSL